MSGRVIRVGIKGNISHLHHHLETLAALALILKFSAAARTSMCHHVGASPELGLSSKFQVVGSGSNRLMCWQPRPLLEKPAHTPTAQVRGVFTVTRV
ncbi:hypothetical protein COLO4_20935 [Corchorus olitorius]|uniref:Uncharacterized protein n=1 Tax=Corchorus olitorius TaxID=93759 RepID=A0A1R3IW11_9ROSI|nr:hypothetical protein COLO4_20935 [Corchorus olitorius]